jgi:hypothetical protein
MAANRRGICALPLWLARQAVQRLPLRWLHLGETGVHTSLLGAFRGEDAELAYLQRFLTMSRQFEVTGMPNQL